MSFLVGLLARVAENSVKANIAEFTFYELR